MSRLKNLRNPHHLYMLLNSSRPTILLTRPHDSSAPLAAALRGRGYEVLVEPMLEIVPLSTPRPDGVFQAVIVTSANALRGLAGRGGNLLDLPCFCIGSRTAKVAQAFGFTQVAHTEGDGRDLARFVVECLSPPNKERHPRACGDPSPERHIGTPVLECGAGRHGQVMDPRLRGDDAGEGGGDAEKEVDPILHPCGADVSSAAQDELKALGHTVTPWPVYKAEAATGFSENLQKSLRAGQVQAALFFSPRSARIFADLTAHYALTPCCVNLSAIGLSGAVVDAMRALPWRVVAAAEAPTEEAVIACLQRLCPVF